MFHQFFYRFVRDSSCLHLTLASPADILRSASRVHSPRGEGTRDARLRMSAGEANLTFVAFCIAFCLLPVICKQFYVISTEFLSLSRRRYFSRNVLSGEKRGETAVFADYVKFKLIFLISATILVIMPPGTTKTTTVGEPFPILTVDL